MQQNGQTSATGWIPTMFYDEQNMLERFKLGLSMNSKNQPELRDSGEHLQFCLKSLGVMLEFWHIERELWGCRNYDSHLP